MAENVWKSLANQLAQTSEETGKSVVSVYGRRHPSSGIIWSKDAVVTASHSLRRDEDITVILSPGQKTTARVAGRDPGTDLAVLRLQSPIEAPAARWGDASKLRVGELVLALARSWRGNVVASSGVISGLIHGPWRTWRGGQIDQFIRPDLNLYPGFSGGPLVSSDGEVVGLNTAGLHRSGITVPAGTITRVAAELLQKGHVERPYLGLAMQSVPLPESLRTKLNLTVSEGLLVAHVEPGSPAEKAGVLLGDVLIELQGKPVADTDAVQEILRTTKAGENAEINLLRAGAAAKITVKLEARPAR
ncbi:MAG TPA: trypsin-like peptidase domain-containing protein [Candidatus Angelobacter sp.]|nr:trypsin-like peptidase domain-containing protein [Candidatus Angelobacter sp.]